MRVYILDAPVVIPLQILDISTVKHLAGLVEYIINYFFVREIQNKLVSAENRLPARYSERPVRMLPVEIAVHIHHLGLYPNSEFNPLRINLFDYFSKTFAKLFLIHGPIAKAGIVVVSLSEPAVVHDNHLYSKLHGLVCQSQKILSLEVEIESFPAVYEHRTLLVSPLSPADMLPDTAVQIV